MTAVENIPPSRLSVEITGLEKGQNIQFKRGYSELLELGGELKDVVPYNYCDDALHNYIPTICKFITIMSVVRVISVITAINQNIAMLKLM